MLHIASHLDGCVQKKETACITSNLDACIKHGAKHRTYINESTFKSRHNQMDACNRIQSILPLSLFVTNNYHLERRSPERKRQTRKHTQWCVSIHWNCGWHHLCQVTSLKTTYFEFFLFSISLLSLIMQKGRTRTVQTRWKRKLLG